MKRGSESIMQRERQQLSESNTERVRAKVWTLVGLEKETLRPEGVEVEREKKNLVLLYN